MKWKVLAGLATLAVLWTAQFVWDYFDPTSIAHTSMQYQLKHTGEAIYEFRSANGRWPASIDDLAQTSLARQNPYYWRQSATAIAILWPKDFKPEAKQNSSMRLAYFRGGLFNQLGRVWVCWGDLRTEHLPEEVLKAKLAK